MSFFQPRERVSSRHRTMLEQTQCHHGHKLAAHPGLCKHFHRTKQACCSHIHILSS